MLADVSEEQPRRRRRVAKSSEPTTDVESTPEVVVAPAADAAPVTAAKAPSGLLHRVHVDPAVGIGIFVPGLFVMAIGGAATWHWIFNVGEAVMLAGMTLFVAAVILTALQQRDLRKAATAPAPAAKREAAPPQPATAEG